MNIILTGAKRSGKSTAARQIMASLSGTVSGFVTVFENRDGGSERALYLSSIDGAKGQKAADWTTGHARAIPETFDRFAPELICPETDSVFIDELGFLEKDSLALKEAVNAAFDRPQNVLAVVRLDARGWMGELKARDDVTVLTVTEDNRNAVPAMVLELLGN